MNFYRSRVYGWIQFSTEKRIQQGMRERVNEKDRKEANEPPFNTKEFITTIKTAASNVSNVDSHMRPEAHLQPQTHLLFHII